ncbi:protein of unknown function [Desulfonauticus submarinus]|uniref:DUF1887 family protein n=1 Tax=Desulfonauticus submarinus TaxID=206665 RepID=A0A1H0FDL6_9BACT|nr:DUF1887 family CARF protein [Desulfonauticus submarinus]SDN92753.1 protein of unknown function [Desulfonauticus submarinus]
MKQLHIMLVSDQPIPNFMPLLLTKFKAEKVALLTSKDKLLKSNILKKNIEKFSMVEIYKILPYNLEQIRKQLSNIVNKYKSKYKIYLNLTGGTKIMTMAGFEICKTFNLNSYYINTYQKQIIHLTPKYDIETLPSNLINMTQYFNLYGYEVNKKSPSKPKNNHLNAINKIIAQPKLFSRAIKTLNFHASESRNKQDLTFKVPTMTTAMKKLLSILKENNILQQINRNVFKFTSFKNLEFCNGGWLEEYTLYTVSQINKIYDFAGTFKVKRENTENEIDVAFCCDNKLFLIECKTKTFRNHKSASTTEPIYKLDSLRQIMGGTFGQAMLISFHQLSSSLLERCNLLNIKTSYGNSLKNLKNIISDWIS